MEKTVLHPYLGKEFVGYVLNSAFSSEKQRKIVELQNKFIKRFGDVFWVPEPDWLHITLMDWIAPLVDYGKDKDEIFLETFDEYDTALSESLIGIAPINVRFGTIGVSPEAIFLRGRDNGQYQQIRQHFIENIELLPNTKRPPQIVHTTILRFTKEVELRPIQDFAAKQTISFEHITHSFRLQRARYSDVEEKEIIKVYQLD